MLFRRNHLKGSVSFEKEILTALLSKMTQEIDIVLNEIEKRKMMPFLEIEIDKRMVLLYKSSGGLSCKRFQKQNSREEQLFFSHFFPYKSFPQIRFNKENATYRAFT